MVKLWFCQLFFYTFFSPTLGQWNWAKMASPELYAKCPIQSQQSRTLEVIWVEAIFTPTRSGTETLSTRLNWVLYWQFPLTTETFWPCVTELLTSSDGQFANYGCSPFTSRLKQTLLGGADGSSKRKKQIHLLLLLPAEEGQPQESHKKEKTVFVHGVMERFPKLC